jgi:putative hydrolase of the HAD superfamily
MATGDVQTILFDAGNTLVHLDYAFIAELLAVHDHPRSPLDIRRAEYVARAAIDRALTPAMPSAARPEQLLWPGTTAPQPSYFDVALDALGVPADEIPAIVAALRAHNAEECLWRVVEADTADVLAELTARGYTLGVISNADGRIEADLARLGLRRHFATVVDSHVVGVEKPDRRIFELALARLGVPPTAALYVGDVFAIDVLGARGAGLTPVLMDALACYPGPVDCLRIARLAELLPLLPAQQRR